MPKYRKVQNNKPKKIKGCPLKEYILKQQKKERDEEQKKTNEEFEAYINDMKNQRIKNIMNMYGIKFEITNCPDNVVFDPINCISDIRIN